MDQAPADGDDTPAHDEPLPSRIVGIGASAGGLEAIEALLSTASPGTRLAYVVIQHLDPQHTSMLGQILGRRTPLPVLDATHGVLALADHVYTIQPGAALELVGGCFRVSARGAEPREVINEFFRSLAADQGSRAVGIVLSGTGSDGTEGLRAIREHGGLTLAQAPETAKYDGMPAAAIAAGVVDHVLPVAQMLRAVLEHAQQSPHRMPPPETGPPVPVSGLQTPTAALLTDEQVAAFIAPVCEILERATGHDFSQYKQGTVLRRLRRRLFDRQPETMEDYLELLASDPQEPMLLANDLLIGVTQFFRDAEALEFLAAHVLPNILETARADGGVRIWVPGCATGEEAYSIGILVIEGLEALGTSLPVQIYATDIDTDAIAVARRSLYPATIAEHVSEARLARFFSHEDDQYRVSREVREMCIFSEHSLIRDPPFLNLDLVSCRNVLIYMDAALQKRVVSILHYALRPSGYLFLGLSESLAAHSELFETVDKQYRVFKRIDRVRRPQLPPPVRIVPRPAPQLVHAPARSAPQELEINAAFERLMLQEYVPPSVVVNERGDVLCVAGLTGRYLQPPAGVLTTNILDLAHSSLRIELRAALHAAARTHTKVIRDGVPVELDDTTQLLRITVRPMARIKPPLFVVILQTRTEHGGVLDEPDALGPDGAMEQLESELRTTRADLRTTIEELESANEALKSSNEELLSTNEEMQSANEELQSSQEELKSLNEELATVNAELSRKVDELGQANSDLQNLFSATDVATVFLNRELRVTKFTPAAKQLFRLIAADVGRPIADLAQRFVDLDLAADTREVLRSLAPVERQVQTLDGHAWYLLRIIPYRTQADAIAGAVVTLADISGIKRAEFQRLASERKYRNLFESIDEGFCVVEVLFDTAENPVDYRFIEVNKAFEQQLGVAHVVGRRMREITATHEEHWFQTFGQVAKTGDPLRIELSSAAQGRHYDVYAFRTGAPEQQWVAVLLNDITERKQREVEREQLLDQLREAQAQLSQDLDGMSRLHKIGSLFLEEGNLEAVLNEIVDAAISVSRADFGDIQLLDGESGKSVVAAQRGLPDELLKFRREHGMSYGAMKAVIERGERVVVEDIEQSPIYANTPALRVHLDAGVRAVESTPIIGRSGAPVGIISTCHHEPGRPGVGALALLDLLARQTSDIFERARAESALRTANAQLLAADERKNFYFGMLSHELRNPLAAVRAALQVFDRADANSDQAQQANAIIRRQVEQLTRMVEDLLDITRISNGKVQLACERLDLDALVRATAQDSRWAFDQRKVAFEVHAAPGPVWVDADPVRLAQAIGNLLQNAAKFSASGTKATLSIERDSRNRRVFVRVQDNGIGIAPELLPRMFEPFFQVDTSLDRSQGGLGLGLAVVKGLIELHGGSVQATSDGPGRGATFTIELPLAREQAPEIIPPTPTPDPNAPPLRVLLIEDNIDTATALTLLLAAEGHTMAAALSGPAGLETARSFRPDAVICDIGLPGMDGYAVARALRAEFGPTLPIIGLSGYAGQENVDKAKDAGFDVYLVKPATPELLSRTLLRLTAARAAATRT